MVTESGGPLGAGGRGFQRLGRSLVAHPFRPIALWVVLLLVALPVLMQIGTATQNSASQVSSGAPSSVASATLGRLFPGSSSPSSSLLLFTGTNITGPTGQAAVLRVASTLASDPKLTDIARISTLYSAYAGTLAGQAELALEVLSAPKLSPAAQVEAAGNLSGLLWGPPAAYLAAWTANVSAHPAETPENFDYPVYAGLAAAYGNGTPARTVLDDFYLGSPTAFGGFNATAPIRGVGDCAAAPANAENCTDGIVRADGPSLLPSLVPANESATGLPLGASLLDVATVANFSAPSTLAAAVVHALAEGSGLAYPWLSTVWNDFGTLASGSSAVSAWATNVSEGPVADYPLPIPHQLRTTFVDGADDATLVFVSFSVDDSTVDAQGHNPVFADVSEIDRVVPAAVLAVAPGGTIGYVQTGPAPLDSDESSVLAQNLAIVLPLTIGILVIITVLYFRSPLAPAVTFAGLGVAIGLGLSGLVLIAKLLGKVDPTAITLETTFVLGVGTDYSIFLVARYREELRKGAASDDAVVTSVTWAGQSIATSGGTAVLATLALAFSGVGLLSQWGETLSLAVAITVLVCLTLVPAMLKLIGPRVFWPETGPRASAAAARSEARIRSGSTYFYRAGHLAQRRPWAVIGVVLLFSLPLAYVALTAPLSYDFYQQLPTQPGPTQGLQELSNTFGPGDAFPTQVLLTFPSPLLVGTVPNATEFQVVAAVTSTINGTPGVASVASPVGPDGAPLASWLTYAASPPGTQQQLAGLLGGFLGTDGRTVLLSVVPTTSGLATPSIQLLGTLKNAVAATLAAEGATAVTAEYAGGAATTTDLAAQTALATERMFLAVSIGLVIVLFAVLRSWMIPLMAVGTIVLSIGWAWGLTQLLFVQGLGLALFFFVPTVLFILILGLGIDYNIFLLTRVREERLRGRSSRDAVLEAVTRTGGIITAAAIILGGAFAALAAGQFVLLKAIGFSVAAAVILDAMVVRTYLVPSALQLLGDRVWSLGLRKGPAPTPEPPVVRPP